MSRRVPAVLVALLVLALPSCGQESSSPTGPAPSGPITYNIAITVLSDATGEGIAAAIITVLDGEFAGQTFETGNDGRVTLTGAEGNMNLEASHEDFLSERQGVGPPATSGATQSLTFRLEPDDDDPPAPPPSSFGPGQHLVGEEIDPGRYFVDPDPGCYWERQSGLGGTIDDVLANEFISGDWMQEIVQIRPSDVAFEGDPECGRWFANRRHGAQSDIPPGKWLVAAGQLTPGTYESNVEDGCYWERLNGFAGEVDQIIANEFVGSAGRELVEIRPGDIGFRSDAECGTWTRTDSASVAEAELRRLRRPRTRAEIVRNRELNRARDDFRR